MLFLHSRCEPNALGILYLAGKIQIDDRHGQYMAIGVPSAITTKKIRKTHLEYCKNVWKIRKYFTFPANPGIHGAGVGPNYGIPVNVKTVEIQNSCSIPGASRDSLL
jgi:hypothetical protein